MPQPWRQPMASPGFSLKSRSAQPTGPGLTASKKRKSAKASAVVVQPPEDATTDGQLMFHLSNFCTARARAKTLDEMLLHKAYFDEPAQRECFMVADFLAYLIQQRVSGASERTIYVALRERDLRSHEATLKGKDVEYWSIPKLNQQTKKFDVVVPDDDVPF